MRVLFAASWAITAPLVAGEITLSGNKSGERVVLTNTGSCSPTCFTGDLLHSFNAMINSRVIVTHVFNPDGGESGIHVSGSLQAYTAEELWAADDLSGGVGVNAYVENNASLANCIEVHESTASSVANNWTEISDPDLDGAPGQRPLILPQVSFGDFEMNYGVWYSSGSARWTIFAEDPLYVMPVGAMFHYAVPPCSDALLFRPVHVVTAANRSSNTTWLSGVTQRPQTLLLVTQLYDSAAGLHNDHPIGVWWDPTLLRWNIYNEDMATMPIGARFVVAEVVMIFKHNFENLSNGMPNLLGWSAVVP